MKILEFTDRLTRNANRESWLNGTRELFLTFQFPRIPIPNFVIYFYFHIIPTGPLQIPPIRMPMMHSGVTCTQIILIILTNCIMILLLH